MGALITKPIDWLIITPFKWIGQFILWFYSTLLPLFLQYAGIPLFILGILLAICFAGGSFLFMLLFFVGGYYFIKNSIFSNPYSKSIGQTTVQIKSSNTYTT